MARANGVVNKYFAALHDRRCDFGSFRMEGTDGDQ
jgi:hypothetical protein